MNGSSQNQLPNPLQQTQLLQNQQQSLQGLGYGSLGGQSAMNWYSGTGYSSNISNVTVTYQGQGQQQSTQIYVGNISGGTLQQPATVSYVPFTQTQIADPSVIRMKDRAIGLTVEFEDGSKLIADADGKYRVEDAAATVTYRANRVLEFNPYVNASDLVARFIRYLGTLGIRQGDVPQLPLGLFVNWLVLEAAEQDQTPAPSDVVPVERHQLLVGTVKPRCLVCHRFVRRAWAAKGFAFCNPEHAGRYHARLAA